MRSVTRSVDTLGVMIVGFQSSSFEEGGAGAMGDEFDEEDAKDRHHGDGHGPGVFSPDPCQTFRTECFGGGSEELLRERGMSR